MKTDRFFAETHELALLLCDTYKQVHNKMYPKNTQRLVSYWVPRKSMLKNQNEMVFFGLQAFIQKYLVDFFDRYFFQLHPTEIDKLYSRAMNTQIGEGNWSIDHVLRLWECHVLPITIRALPEGTKVPMGIPCIEITNSRPGFAWVVQWVECLLQMELWKPCTHATIGLMYRNIVDKYYEETVDGGKTLSKLACADFGMRGMSCKEEAEKATAAWLLSFDKTSTIPALSYIDRYYDARTLENKIGMGAISTEHSVMSANFAVDGDEETFYRKMLRELYPDTSFSIVSDTYDYWRIIDEVLPRIKDDVMAHNGKMLIRPDSGYIVDIAVKTIDKLWDIFGGTVNSKGYKVLDPHIGIIYGDACTMENVEMIFSILKEKGYAANNIVFGVGAFCFSAIRNNGELIVVTRDTFGIAMKATSATIDGKTYHLFKDPKTDTQHLKASHRGCCDIFYDDKGILQCVDGYFDIKDGRDSAMVKVFEDGHVLNTETFSDIRNRLYPVEKGVEELGQISE